MQRAGGPPLGAPRVALRPLGLCVAEGALGTWRGGKRIAHSGVHGLAENATAGRTDAGVLQRPQFEVPMQLTKSLRRCLRACWWPSPWRYDSYLVDSASSHMLVSKIKPCMSKYKQLYSETANGSLYKLSFI